MVGASGIVANFATELGIDNNVSQSSATVNNANAKSSVKPVTAPAAMPITASYTIEHMYGQMLYETYAEEALGRGKKFNGQAISSGQAPASQVQPGWSQAKAPEVKQVGIGGDPVNTPENTPAPEVADEFGNVSDEDLNAIHKELEKELEQVHSLVQAMLSASKAGNVNNLAIAIQQTTGAINKLDSTAQAAEEKATPPEAAPIDTGPGADIEWTETNSADIGRKLTKILATGFGTGSSSLADKNGTDVTFTDEEKTQLKGIVSKDKWDTVPEETRKKVVQVERVQYKFTSSSNKFLKEFYKNTRPVPIERTSK
jgi:hypothetical protein